MVKLFSAAIKNSPNRNEYLSNSYECLIEGLSRNKMKVGLLFNYVTALKGLRKIGF
jgi:hypothetical protein